MIGQSIGTYQILEKLGQGGMGEVYRARDTRLGRDVAIKILPGAFTSDPDRLARFEREARVLASLNHPHIATIHGIEDTDGVPALVMELVEGETLAERIAKGPISIAAALPLARQIADALDAAHKKGIVHRDLKPANVKITGDGVVKLLDFGLAKALVRYPASATAGDEAPTLTIDGTRDGAIMGTAAYMSPEQARGLPVDKRTDIWAFGCVLYEMLTGRPAFPGRTFADVIAAVLEREPDWSVLPAATPANVGRSLRRCLAKSPDQRASDIADVRAELGAGAPSRRRHPAALIVGGFAAAVLVLLLALLVSGASWLTDIGRIANRSDGSAVQSLAILPFRPIDATTADSLGLGLADTIITKVSQTAGLMVLPTSSVRRYATRDVDALATAKALNVDAVLDGTLQRAGDRLRVSVNLLRIQDGASLWSETFDTRLDDIFALQDQVSLAIVSQLRLRLDASQRSRLTRPETSSAAAYDYYAKALAYFDDRGVNAQQREPSDRAIELLKQAIELDPDYARAHALIGHAYAWTAVFIEADRRLIELAQEELAVAARLDPQLALTHVVRAFILWSQYENWQITAAVNELKAAQKLDPNAAHGDLATLYFHVGLEEQWKAERELSLKLDPTSEQVKAEYVNEYFFAGLPEEARAALTRFGRPLDARYYLALRRLDEAAPLVERALKQSPQSTGARVTAALLYALQGKHLEAQATVQEVVPRLQRNRSYHHSTYLFAVIYALGGRADQAVQWLRTTSDEGFSQYPLFLRDPALDRVRQDPAFVQFMAESRELWERHQRELK